MFKCEEDNIFSIIDKNCFGWLECERGHCRVPEPSDKITGTMTKLEFLVHRMQQLLEYYFKYLN